MVVVLQLDQEASIIDDPLTGPQLRSLKHHHPLDPLGKQPWPNSSPSDGAGAIDSGPPRARGRHPLDSLLACYPVTMSLACNLDLNDLHALSRSSYQIRERLLDFRHQIMPRTLHCMHEPLKQEKALTGRWAPPCARDMVAPCKRCSRTVCRNCTIKPPSNRELPRRYRRLCRTCQKAHLSLVTVLPKPMATRDDIITESVFGRGPCTCEDLGVYICKDCHTSKTSDDINYTRVWTWRSRYHSLGFGLGTGIGEGNEGVKCGRGQHCLSARDIIVDMDCAEDGKTTAIVDDHGEEILDLHDFNALALASDGDSHRDDSAGYYRQEIEGIGGIVKKKLKKRVRVGAAVAEHEDERETGTYLGRERNAKARSWCAWCDRVLPSLSDQDELQGLQDAL